MTTTAQALEAMPEPHKLHCGPCESRCSDCPIDWENFTPTPDQISRFSEREEVTNHIESTAAEIARLQAELSTLRAATASVQADQRAENAMMAEALRLARPYVEEFTTRWCDGTGGHSTREESKRRLALIDAALSTSTAPSGA